MPSPNPAADSPALNQLQGSILGVPVDHYFRGAPALDPKVDPVVGTTWIVSDRSKMDFHVALQDLQQRHLERDWSTCITQAMWLSFTTPSRSRTTRSILARSFVHNVYSKLMTRPSKARVCYWWPCGRDETTKLCMDVSNRRGMSQQQYGVSYIELMEKWSAGDAPCDPSRWARSCPRFLTFSISDVLAVENLHQFAHVCPPCPSSLR